jgi:hypothetical protein
VLGSSCDLSLQHFEVKVEVALREVEAALREVEVEVEVEGGPWARGGERCARNARNCARADPCHADVASEIAKFVRASPSTSTSTSP